MTEESREFSAVGDEQLDELEAGPDAELYEAVLTACDLILDLPGEAQLHSTTVVTARGTVLRLPVPGHRTHVYWTSGPPPRVEAVFPVP